MSEPADFWGYSTPSQAEGERDPEGGEHPDVDRSTPSQAEGERIADEEAPRPSGDAPRHS
ncbi:hypothetical protein [Streptomyces sp. NPDC047097]|uniref:hypothetical protein n=1 Tax=Streptomyces sp. NPDC047097 TaxID=3155260 RepID=UPI0033FAF195